MRRLFTILAVALSLVACKQGEGEPCQVDTDCASGLTCNQSSKECQAGAVGPDDASGVDAPLDAGIDAVAVDAQPVDALPIDAGTIDAPAAR